MNLRLTADDNHCSTLFTNSRIWIPELRLKIFDNAVVFFYWQIQNHSYNCLKLMMGEELPLDVRNHKISKVNISILLKGTDFDINKTVEKQTIYL